MRYIRWFEEIGIEDVPLVGGKNASLGEMYRDLTTQGVKIPDGFAVTAEAYWHVVNPAGILDELMESMAGCSSGRGSRASSSIWTDRGIGN